MMKTAWMISLAILLLSGCVTVKLSNTANGKKAEGVNYREPSSPFKSDSRDDVDASWLNPNNGNAISFLSDCKDPSDPPLENIVAGVLSGLTGLKYESEDTPIQQGREARRVVATGKVDGVPSGIELLVFKRNTCIYILSYVGVKKSFNENRAEFGRFVEGFKAP